MYINNFDVSGENFEININNLNYSNTSLELNNKFDLLLDGILLQNNKKDDLN